MPDRPDNPPAFVPCKGGWTLCYDDGGDKIEVSYDTASTHVPDNVQIEMGSGGGQWLYVDVADIPWLIDKLQKAAGAIDDARKEGGAS